MPYLTPLRKAMIVIAVSKYKGLPDLPGTLTSANRIAKWAEGDSPARNYTVLKITDEEWVDEHGQTQSGKPVTRDRLEKEIRPFIGGAIWDRVVVYFAGHGMMGTSLSDYWLLHDAVSDPAEGVNFIAFKSLMEHQGIGSLGGSMGLYTGQVSYIVDACRTVEGNLAGFLGSPILRKVNELKPLETDLFLSTVRGAHAFQPNATQDHKAFCLFSDALSDALEGRVPEVIETEYHQHAPVITSATLTRWIRQELPIRAKTYKETLEADPMPGFVSSNDFYEVFANIPDEESMEFSTPDEADTAEEMSEAFDGASDDVSEESAASDDASGIEDLSEYVMFTSKKGGIDGLVHVSELSSDGRPSNSDEDLIHFDTNDTRIVRDEPEPEPESTESATAYPMILAKEISDGPVTIQNRPKLAVPRDYHSRIEGFDHRLMYWPIDDPQGRQPLFVQNPSDQSWTMLPFFSDSTSSVVLTDYPGDVFLVDHRGYLTEPDVSLTRFAALQPARMSDAMKLADAIRPGKALYPNQANRAGYLYYLASDRANALRTAHFMAQDDLLSFDLALVAAQDIRWRLDETGRWRVYANLAAIGQGSTDDGDRPIFTRTAFEARSDVPLTSLFPIFRQGWDLLQIMEFDTMPEVMIEIASRAGGRNVTVLPDDAMELVFKTFHYDMIDFGGSNDQAPDIHTWD